MEHDPSVYDPNEYDDEQTFESAVVESLAGMMTDQQYAEPAAGPDPQAAA